MAKGKLGLALFVALGWLGLACSPARPADVQIYWNCAIQAAGSPAGWCPVNTLYPLPTVGGGGGSGVAGSAEGNATGTGSAQTIFTGNSAVHRSVLLQVQGADVWACSFKNTSPSISGNVGFQLKAGTSNITGDGGSYSTPPGYNDNGTLTCVTAGASDHLYWSYQ
jgi:hypothetical protein